MSVDPTSASDTSFMSPSLAIVVSLFRFIAEERPELASQIALIIPPWVDRMFVGVDRGKVFMSIYRALDGKHPEIEKRAREAAERELRG